MEGARIFGVFGEEVENGGQNLLDRLILKEFSP